MKLTFSTLFLHCVPASIEIRGLGWVIFLLVREIRERFEFSQWREELFQKHPNVKANKEKRSALTHPEKTSIFVKSENLCSKCI